MDGLRNRSASVWQRVFAAAPEPSMSHMLAAAIGESVPDDLRTALQELDRGAGWNQSKKAEEWVSNACLRAHRPDVLVEKINRYRVERLTGIRQGAMDVAALLRDCPSLGHIEFHRTSISQGEARALVRAFQDGCSLLSLSFRDCTVSDDVFSSLIGGISAIGSLQTLRIEALSGQWLSELGACMAGHKTLTSLMLVIPDLSAGKALKLGKSLAANRMLTALELDVMFPAALTSLLQGLASDGLRVGAPGLTRLDLRSHASLDGAFCRALSDCIEMRETLASVCIRPGLHPLPKSAARLRAAIEKSSVRIDLHADRMPQPLAGLAQCRPLQQLVVPLDAAFVAACQLLQSLPAWRSLPRELKTAIEGYLVGNGPPRDFWALLGVDRTTRGLVQRLRNAVHGHRFTAPMGRPDLPYEPDLDAFMQFWRLQLAGLDGDGSAAVRPEWQLTPKESSGLSPDQRDFRRTLMQIGQQLFDKHLAWTRQQVEEGHGEVAAFALGPLQRLAKACGFDREGEVAELNRRVALGEVRYQRRNASFHIACSLGGLVFWLAMADGLADAALRHVVDPNRAYGIGSPKSFEAGKSQRGTGLGLALGVIVLLYLLFRIADQRAARMGQTVQPDTV